VSLSPAAICAELRAYWLGRPNFWERGDRLNSEGVYPYSIIKKRVWNRRPFIRKKILPKNETAIYNY
jgi:hypothetical protein